MGVANVLKSFYSISEFYNYIKNPDTSPNAGSRLFTLVPYVRAETEINNALFTIKNLYDLAICTQSLEIPDVTYKESLFEVNTYQRTLVWFE